MLVWMVDSSCSVELRERVQNLFLQPCSHHSPHLHTSTVNASLCTIALFTTCTICFKPNIYVNSYPPNALILNKPLLTTHIRKFYNNFIRGKYFKLCLSEFTMLFCRNSNLIWWNCRSETYFYIQSDMANVCF